MKHLDLFSGIGGFSLAADRVWNNVEHIFCDYDNFSQKTIKEHYPEAHVFRDIREIKEVPTVELLTGGFPCQPVSQAGQRRGTEDDRYLWPEMLRVIQLAKPTWVIAENVYGLLTLEGGIHFETVCTDLEANEYEVQPLIIPACAIGAPHKRDRVWFVAHSKSFRRSTMDKEQENRLPNKHSESFEAFWRSCARLHISLEPDFDKADSGAIRNDDGLPSGVDRLKALGNAIVPQVAEEIMRAIKATNTI